MLTEYSSYDDIRKFRDKAREKFSKMYDGWLGKELERERIKWRKLKNFNNNKVITFDRTFKIENQVVKVSFTPSYSPLGDFIKSHYSHCLSTKIETSKGKYTIILGDNVIEILTAHYTKRFKERLGGYVFYQWTDIIPYTRNGKTYELECSGDGVHITRRVEKDIVKHITILHRDMCTSKNYQELFERAGKAIDEHDIYEWK